MAAAEVDRYDRQIRAWGFATQKRLQSTRFLFVGLNQVALECLKNLVLAGAAHVASTGPECDADRALFEFIRGLNPHSRVSVVALCPAELAAADVVCVFGPASADVLEPCAGRTVLVAGAGRAELASGIEGFAFSASGDDASGPVERAIFGALVSQFVVDYLPPHAGPVAARLVFDAATLTASVSRVA